MTYDVVIIGAGVAGLTLAYQLKQADEHIRIAVIHEGTFPNRDVTAKVGESINEIAAIYLAQYLGLTEFMREAHPVKMGMRFFQINEDSYKEMGLNSQPINESFHFERGKLENNLFELIKEKVTFFQQHKYIDFETRDNMHNVGILSRTTGEKRFLTARWVVDAGGLKKLLARKFGIDRRLPIDHSSVWFRVNGAVNVDEFLPRDEGSPFTSERRSWSSIHLEGAGYWIWILRLSETVTSVGLIFDEKMYDFREVATWDKLLGWLKIHVSTFADYLEEKQFPLIDFKFLRRFASEAEYWVSDQRWAVIGDAYGLWDPYYSNGFDIIAYQNTMLVDLIRADRAGEVIQKRIKDANQLISYIMQGMGNVFSDFYHRKGRWYYICVKYNIDSLLYIPILCTIMHNALHSMFVDEDDDFRKKIIGFAVAGGILHGNIVHYLKTDAFKENGFSAPDRFWLDVMTYDAFVPERDIRYEDKERIFALIERNLHLMRCAYYYIKNGGDYIKFIRARACFAITKDTDSAAYEDNISRLEADLFNVK